MVDKDIIFLSRSNFYFSFILFASSEDIDEDKIK